MRNVGLALEQEWPTSIRIIVVTRTYCCWKKRKSSLVDLLVFKHENMIGEK